MYLLDCNSLLCVMLLFDCILSYSLLLRLLYHVYGLLYLVEWPIVTMMISVRPDQVFFLSTERKIWKIHPIK